MNVFENKQKDFVRRVGKTMVEGLFSERLQRRKDFVNYEEKKEAINKVTKQLYDMTAVEFLEQTGNKNVKESVSFMRENVRKNEVINSTGDDSDIYTTMIVSFIDDAFEPELLARGLIQTLNVDTTGTGSFKVPKDADILTAVTINTDGTFPSEETTSFEATDEQVDWSGLYTLIPQQLVSKANVDILAHRFTQMGRAISRKADSDVITEMVKATTAGDSFYGTNNNVVQLGSSTDIDILDVFDGIGAMIQDDAECTDVLFNGTNYAKIMRSNPELINAVSFNGAGGTLNSFEGVTDGNGMTVRFHYSSQVPDNTTFLVDRNKFGYFGDAGDIVTFDARVNKTVQNEVGAYKPYGVRISQPKSVYKIEDNT